MMFSPESTSPEKGTPDLHALLELSPRLLDGVWHSLNLSQTQPGYSPHPRPLPPRVLCSHHPSPANIGITDSVP